MAAATEVFNIPELLELILLSLPWHGTHQEISSSRTIQLGQGTCRAWRALVQQSTPIRQKLYRATPADRRDMKAWSLALVEPPARPNPWIPNLLLHQRSWGQADPFDQADDVYRVRDDAPRLWAFALEISQAQFLRVPEAGPWREMLATSPPFTDFWYTRCFYELGSGRAPFVTHVDYNATLPKCQQKYRVHCKSGITLGMIVDAMSELFAKNGSTRFVMVESLPVQECPVDTPIAPPMTKVDKSAPTTQEVHDWYCGL